MRGLAWVSAAVPTPLCVWPCPIGGAHPYNPRGKGEGRMTQRDGSTDSLAVRREAEACLAAAVGLAFLWPCMGSSATMHFRHAMSASASALTTPWHAVIMGALYVLAVACCALGASRLRSVLAPARIGRFALVAGLAGLAGHVTLVATPLLASTGAATAVTLAGFALTVGFIVAHVLVWFHLLARVPLRRALFVLAASTALAYALQLACDLAMGSGMLAVLVVCPLGSGAGAFAAARLLGGVPGATSAPAGVSLRGLPWRRVASLAALIYLEQALTSLLFQRYAAWPRDNLTFTLAGGLVIWLAASAVVWHRPRAGAWDARAAYVSLLALLLVVYMATLLLTVVLPATGAPVAERLLVCAGSSFRTLLWMALAVAVARSGASALAAGLTYVAVVLAVPVSRLASLAFAGMDASLVATFCSPAVIVPLTAAILFVVAGSFVLANARATRTLMAELADASSAQIPSARASRRARACAELARDAGLTPRETEVLGLVCDGYSARHAGERLGISESTVVSHVSHIYRKTGVSSRQQLVALVDAEDGGGA